MKLLYIAGVSFLLVGCSVSKPLATTQVKKVESIKYISQEIALYSKNFKDTNTSINQKDFEDKYFSAWGMDPKTYNKKQIQWAFDSFKYGDSYGENLQIIDDSFFKKMKENANYNAYGSVNKNALSLYELNIRAFPSDKPLLRNPKLAGEGFPFDYLQNSTVHANKPLFITHYSKDKQWAHIFTSFAYGWVKTKDIITLQSYQVELWKKAQQIYITKEGENIYDKEGHFLFKTKLGMLFALIGENKNSFRVLAVSSYKFNQGLFHEVEISKQFAHKDILKFNKNNLENIAQEILKSNYGWGGMYGQRDCSSSIRDFFAPFGVWLPRNSYQQSKIGKVVSLHGLEDENKIKTIKEQAKPFKTLLYKKGHIMLYTGVVNGQITLLQNVWGVKTKEKNQEGRFVVGKTIFSTLSLGSTLDNYDTNASIVRKLESFNTIVD